MEEMGPQFWQYVEAESKATDNFIARNLGNKLQDMHREMLTISQAAQVLYFHTKESVKSPGNAVF